MASGETRERIRHLESAIRAGLPRRELLRRGLFALAAGLLPTFASARPRFTAYPFTLGVMSGYPTPTGVTLWTRLAPQPLQPDGGMTPEWVTVTWEVARDEAFSDIVATGRYKTAPDLAHSLRIDIDGLEPDRVYHYRFRAEDAVSPVGRTRTAPLPTAVRPLCFAVGSCQHYEQGYFSAYDHLLADAPDLVFFVGDYIYESSWGRDLVRRHIELDPRSLPDYRRVHAQYRLDPSLQRIQQVLPWVFTWDDHEVQNDYAGLEAESRDPAFWLRRAAAYQAFHEHTPLPAWIRPTREGMRLYGAFGYGALARFHVLDCRQYRDPLPCQPPEGGNSWLEPADCHDLQAERSLLGAEQERWLAASLRDSRAPFDVVVQSTLVADTSRQGDGIQKIGTDSWSGYPRARDRLIRALAQRRDASPLVVGGDVHAFYACDLLDDFERPERARKVAAELVCSSITGQGWPAGALDPIVAHNPHVKLARPELRGYLEVTVGAASCQARLRHVDSEKTPTSRIATLAEYEIRRGLRGIAG